MVFRIFVATMLIALGLLAYVLLRPEQFPVESVRVEQNGQQLSLGLGLCIAEGTARAEVNEFSDRVEVKIDGKIINADCASGLQVSLTEPLRNRYVVAGSPARTFEFCGSDSLCRS